MPLNTTRAAVGTTPVDLKSAEADGIHGQRIYLANRSGAAIFLGPSGVTDANGYELTAGEEMELFLEKNEELFAVAGVGTIGTLRLDVLRTGV